MEQHFPEFSEKRVTSRGYLGCRKCLQVNVKNIGKKTLNGGIYVENVSPGISI